MEPSSPVPPGRNGEAVAKWVHEIASKRTDAHYELVDIRDSTWMSSPITNGTAESAESADPKVS